MAAILSSTSALAAPVRASPPRSQNMRTHLSSRAALCTAHQAAALQGRPLRLQSLRVQARRNVVEVTGTIKLTAPRPKKVKKRGSNAKLSLLSAGLTVPHPDKVASGGEDAFMVQMSDVGGGAIGVADGVGGWNAQGVNPGAYSRCLCHFARVAILQDEKKKRQSEATGDGLLAQLLASFRKAVLKSSVSLSSKGVMAKAQARSKVPGSATMVLARMDPVKSVLDVCNLGDAGLRIIRNGKVLKATQDQQYEFDMPYQMACQEFVDIEYNKAQLDSNSFTFLVQEGDWIIAGSDGLFDNMFDSEIETLQAQAAKKGSEAGDEYFTVQVVARALGERAKRYSRDKLRRVPYGVALAADSSDKRGLAKLASSAMALGGKLDDITVVVSKVTSRGKKNTKAFSMAEQDSETHAKDVQRIAEDAIEENALKKLSKYDFSAGTIKVTGRKKK